ncbi:LysE family translocator [Vibrio tapetis]|uniref:Lysine exporter protein (LYSE/YGGA) n=1 Tax=Vibrio tapetis subsp. tapetis TaxID=1671868 RepID=A0A2N8ZA65_9VIBR|nr:LysE family translocator [Vibrio tapetis]SON48777.1 Lysine exporter protein (LYSE/YGGA) [Vibrio tapetis subsp. tapetis]
MQLLNIEAFLIAITILTLTPGLDTALVIRNTSRNGALQGSITSLGICLGLFVHATFSAIGISAILLQSAEMFMVMKWVGAAYLIWLGIGSLKTMWRGGDALKIEAVNSGSQGDWRKSLKEGFLSNVLNPKTAVFYLAFLPQFIHPDYSPFLQSLLMASIHFFIAMVWQCSIALMINRAKGALSNTSFVRWLEGATGVVLVALGVKLIMEEPL